MKCCAQTLKLRLVLIPLRALILLLLFLDQLRVEGRARQDHDSYHDGKTRQDRKKLMRCEIGAMASHLIASR
jgi:hypothetical protein